MDREKRGRAVYLNPRHFKLPAIDVPTYITDASRLVAHLTYLQHIIAWIIV